MIEFVWHSAIVVGGTQDFAKKFNEKFKGITPDQTDNLSAMVGNNRSLQSELAV